MFEGIYGHRDVTSYLSRAIQAEGLPQCLILAGDSGLGKATITTQLIRHIICKESRTSRCYCEYCVEVLRGRHISVNWYKESEDHDSFVVEQARDIISKIKSRTSKDTPIIFVISVADNMTSTASNALLKTLEEPQENVIFILIATDIERVMHTIKSRAITLSLHPVSKEDIKNYLERRVSIYNDIYINLSGGNFGTLHRIVDGDYLSIRNSLWVYLSDLKGLSSSKLFEARALFGDTIEEVRDRFNILLTLLVDAVVMARGVEFEVRNADIQEEIERWAKSVGDNLISYLIIVTREFYQRLVPGINLSLQVKSFLIHQRLGVVPL